MTQETKSRSDGLVRRIPSEALVPANLEQAMNLAKVLAESDLVPKEYRGKPGNILVAIQMGSEVGLKWAQALQSIAVIGGRPSIWGDAGLGIVMASGFLESIEESDDPATETATCRLRRKGAPGVVERSFSQADAEKITVWERDAEGKPRQVRLADRPVWKAGYKKRMRQMRARWWAMKDLFPDVLKGLEGREWIEEDVAVESAQMVPGEAPAATENPFMPKQRPARPPSDGATQGGEEAPGDSRSAGTGIGDAAEQTPTAPAEAPAVAPEQLTMVNGADMTFEIQGRKIATAGATREQMLKIYKLRPVLDTLTKPGTAKEILGRDFGVEHARELGEKQAAAYIAKLSKAINQATPTRKK